MSAPVNSGAISATPHPHDTPPRLGASITDDGVDFAVYAANATGVELCLFDAAGGEELRTPLIRHAGGVWAGRIAGVSAGQLYGFRADGPWSPAQGLRYNHHKLLVDPYARAIVGDVTWRPEVFGHVVDDGFAGDGDSLDERDSAAYVPRSVVVDDAFDWGADRAPRRPWNETVIYEAHVRGLTQTHPGIPPELRGTYAAVAHPVTVAHLQLLGVTAVELLPVHSFTSEPHLVKENLENYWGYNTLGFFAPHAAYASSSHPAEVLREFKGMVKLLHEAGIEVILDVVYNHTCEQSSNGGASLCLRGLDNSTYYRLDERGRDVDVTGCGNTLDLCDHVPMRLVLDSLRYWVSEMHVDGFRFDLAVALGRDHDDSFRPDHPFYMAMRTDPVLSQVKLIAEPWDVGSHGWRTGQFPAPFAEWNDRFRDTVRSFWLGDVAADLAGQPGHGVRDLGTRLAGSRDLFDSPGRSPMSSINYVTAHDGFPVADLTAYDTKHNEANCEDNRDGSDNNRSWNFGQEGHQDADCDVESLRRRGIRNLLATLLMSSGVPMLLGGDELGRSQGGNNNAYCQNNPISWFDWDLQPWKQDLIESTSFLIQLRAAHPVLRQRSFFPGDPIDGDALAALHWHGADGSIMSADEWNAGTTRTLQVVFDGADIGDDRLLLVLHGSARDGSVTLPTQHGVTVWQQLWSSDLERPESNTFTVVPAGNEFFSSAASFSIFLGQ